MAILQFDDQLSSSHSHSTKFDDRISELTDILASVIQGSAIGRGGAGNLWLGGPR